MPEADTSKTLTFKGREIRRDKNGYLLNPLDWSQDIAEMMAKEEGLKMDKEENQRITSKHMDVIVHLRDRFFNFNEEQPNTRKIVKAMKEQWNEDDLSAKDLYDLFPQDPSKQGSRFAGLPESRRKGGY